MRDYANMPTCLLSAAAARELKVVFSGEGGDETFAGYGRYRVGWLERLGKSLMAPGTGGFRVRGTFRGRWPSLLFNPELQKANRDYRKPFAQAWSQTPGTWSDLQRMQYVDMTTALPDNLLVKADRMMMAWGLEGRVPFLDHRIVEFGLALPDNLKISSGHGKLFLKKWASRFLPAQHLYAPKKGFHVPVGEWLGGEILAGLRKQLPGSAGVADWFDTAGIERMIDACKGSSVTARMVWAIFQFAIWHRIYIQGDGERPPETMDPLELLS
jgi:asparagine synthase (glutamine-hydrolysing)